jgi:endonuclease/exonuclease/phosphatase (EEP) superfamily protein YafD
MVCRLALLGALGSGCAAAPHVPAAPGDGRPHVTVASFNLYFPAADDAPTVEAVGETLADVVFLQEVSPRWQSVLGERYHGVYPYQLFAAAGGASGLGVLSLFPLEDEGLLPPLLKHPAWLVRVQAPGGAVDVLNVHLRASRRPGQGLLAGLFTLGSDHEAEIQGFLRACAVQPDLVVGDFNEGPRGSAVAWLTQRGFIDVSSGHHPIEATWRTLSGLVRSTLDHILVRGRFAPADAWVLHAGNSDHWPLIARL